MDVNALPVDPGLLTRQTSSWGNISVHDHTSAWAAPSLGGGAWINMQSHHLPHSLALMVPSCLDGSFVKPQNRIIFDPALASEPKAGSPGGSHPRALTLPG